jgi:Domain of unknown function (DUF4835)
MKIYCLGFILFFQIQVFGQELNVSVLVDAEQIQLTDKSIVNDMRTNISQFLNSRKWTNDKFQINEKIKVNFNLKLTEMPAISQFKGALQIQFSRPVYGSNYESLSLNFLDKDFNFSYVQGQPIQYNDNTFTDNLSSMLAFYAYFILGMDYDSFSKMGGNPFFEKTLQIVINAAQVGEGWSQNSSNPNSRYLLNENMNNPQFTEFREYTYQYYRLGLDQMSKSAEDGRNKIIEALPILKKINDTKPNSCLFRTYFNTKKEELVKILADANPQQKNAMVELLKSIDPINTNSYDKIMTGN